MLETAASTILSFAATTDAYALYAKKLFVLHGLSLLTPPILYPAGGVDYFPAAYGETVYLDYDPQIYPEGYLRYLRKRFPAESGVSLPEDAASIRTVCADLRSPDAWTPRAQGAATLMLKGAAQVPRHDDNQEKGRILRSLADGVVDGGVCLLFDQDLLWSEPLSSLGWTPVPFPESAAGVLARPGGVIEFIGPDLEYAVGIRSGGAVRAFRKPLAS